MSWCKEIVLEAEEGIVFSVLQERTGELVIRASFSIPEDILNPFGLPTILAGEYAEVLSVYTDKDGNQAVVPPGWTVSGIEKENTIWGKDLGLVIYRIPKEELSAIRWENVDLLGIWKKTYDYDLLEIWKKTYNQFVWVPVEKLSPNGTLDGISFTEKFGRRNYDWGDEFSENKFHETLTDELALQLESVKKYGGFYISRYNISKSERAGKPQSVREVMPWVYINFDNAKKVASTIEDNETVKSHLIFGVEYDSVLEWFIKSKARTRNEIVRDSNDWGNLWYTKFSPRRVVETGGSEKWCTNNIYDFSGNVRELTQEQNESSYRVVRGGNSDSSAYSIPACSRLSSDLRGCSPNIGFRAALYIK